MTFTEQKLQELEKFGEIYTLPHKSDGPMSVFGITRPSGFRMNAKCDTETLKSFLSQALQDHAEYLIKRIDELGERLLDRCGDDCLLKMKKEAIKIIRSSHEI